jgi:hypothetical protein
MIVTGVRWPRPRAEAPHGRAEPTQAPIDPPPAQGGIGPAGLTQKQAARLLGVSVGWLRASACPKVLLPGNGPKGKPMLRYFQDDVLAWAKVQGTSATLTQDGSPSATAAVAPAVQSAENSGENFSENSDQNADDHRRGKHSR